MSRFWKVFLCLFCSCCFCSARADLDIFSRIYLSDRSYAKNIEVKAYLVTKDQVVKVFSEENVEVIQKPNKELFGQEIFLLVRCKNFGDYHSFGLINCKVPHRGDSILIDVTMMPGYMKSFYDTVIPMDSRIVPNDDKIPVISCKWKSLYTI